MHIIFIVIIVILLLLFGYPWLKEKLGGVMGGDAGDGYRRVEPDDFSHLSLDHYDRGERWLVSRSFVRLADYQIPGLGEDGAHRRTFLRSLTGEEGGIVGSLVWYAAGEGDTKVALGLMAFETELSDGEFLITCNTDAEDLKLGDLWATAPGVRVIRRPPSTTPSQLLLEHQTSLRERLAKGEKGLEPRPLTDWDELTSSKRRMAALLALRPHKPAPPMAPGQGQGPGSGPGLGLG
jgi:hypothetical protein